MMIKRTLATTIRKTAKTFPILLVTGPRQVGKTTLLEFCASKNRRYVSLDDLDQREIAKKDPALFLQTHKPPVTIDEVQYAPELFSAIKVMVDREGKPGMFWLTGSQKFHLMQNVSETLAGRVAILDLLGLSNAELGGRADISRPFLPTRQWINAARSHASKSMTLKEVYKRIWLGSFPRIATNHKTPRDIFYKSYLQTYIQRDVRDMMRIGDENTFLMFVRAAAARTGQLLNYNDLARDVGVDNKTVKSWLSILEASGLVYLLSPYHTNVTKRLVKTPKLYFLDTGLCSYLTQWSSPEALEAGAMSGPILETFMLAEILKSYWHNGESALFYFYRDKDQKEIDLIIDRDGMLYPVEFKKTATPSASAAGNFSTLERLNKPVGHGAVICLRESDIPLSRDVDAIPVGYL